MGDNPLLNSAWLLLDKLVGLVRDSIVSRLQKSFDSGAEASPWKDWSPLESFNAFAKEIDDILDRFADGCFKRRLDDDLKMVRDHLQKLAKVGTNLDDTVSIIAWNWEETRVERDKRLGEFFHELARNVPNIDFLLRYFAIYPTVELPDVINEMINDVIAGLEKGYLPIKSTEGSGGVYIMRGSSGEATAVFKPTDEEPKAVKGQDLNTNTNPQALTSKHEGLKRGTWAGEGASKEVVAFKLDHPITGPRSISSGEIGFSGVPPTVMVSCSPKALNHPQGNESTATKIGSLQKFMKNDGSCGDFGYLLFPVEEVHKITVLDIRLANADRHDGNILYRKERDKGILVPIDHGYCLPEEFEDCTFVWLNWPQAKEPYSAETIKYIKSLDAEQDIVTIESDGQELSYKCSSTLRISTMLLKKGAERGLTAFDIGSIMCRKPPLKKKSKVEKIVSEAQENMIPGMNETAFLESVSQIMERHLDKLPISTMFRKKGAERGLTPDEIKSIKRRKPPKKESIIEEIVREARENMLLGMIETAFLESVSQIMERRLDELVP